VVLDESRKATKRIITSTGGTISATASDGTEYTLTIPANAIPGYQELLITLTPVTNMTGLPVSGEFISGVSLSPDGLDLVEPVSVTIRLPHPLDPATFIGFSHSVESPDVGPLPLFPWDFGQDSVTLRLAHFSEHGMATGTTEDIQNLSGSSKSNYDYFRGLLTDLFHEIEVEQWLSGEGFNNEDISPEMRQQLKDILKQAGAEAILPALRGASDLAELDAAMRMFLEWRNDIQHIFLNDTDLALLIQQVGNVMAEKIPGIFQGLDQACLQETEPCQAKEYVRALFKWTDIVQNLEDISTSISIPSPAEFCRGIADKLVAIVDMVPDEEWVITGGRFQVTAEALNWKGETIDAPLTWSFDNSAVAEIDPESGVGEAKDPGLMLVTATTECGETSTAEIRVVSLTGTWEPSVTNHQTDCNPPKSSFAPDRLSITQDGAKLSMFVPGYGSWQGAILNLNSLRGQDPSPYWFDFVPQIYEDTAICNVFWSDIDQFMGDGSCSPNEVICIPISCEERLGAIGTIIEQGTIMKGEGGSQTWWEMTTEDSDWVTTDWCDEWGDLRLELKKD